MSRRPVRRDDWSDQILQQFDNCAKDYNFPLLNNEYFDSADVRLTAFTSNTEWLCVFEIVCLSSEHHFADLVYAYGNKIPNPGMQRAEDVVESAPDQPIWTADGDFALDLLDFSVIVNGQLTRFRPTRADYKRAGIDVAKPASDGAEMLRFLAYIAPSDIFLSKDRLLSVCKRQHGGLREFCQLEDWDQPDVADDQMPSESACLRSLARAISQGDPQSLVCPEELHNTHWSNWPKV